jgi:hypothetical protein
MWESMGGGWMWLMRSRRPSGERWVPHRPFFYLKTVQHCGARFQEAVSTPLQCLSRPGSFGLGKHCGVHVYLRALGVLTRVPSLLQFSAVCKKAKPDCLIVGELIHGNYNNWIGPDLLDSGTNYQHSKVKP